MKTKSTYKSCDFVANIKISGCGDAFAVTRFVNTLSDMLIKYQGVLSNEETGEGLEGDGDANSISVLFSVCFCLLFPQKCVNIIPRKVWTDNSRKGE